MLPDHNCEITFSIHLTRKIHNQDALYLLTRMQLHVPLHCSYYA